MLQIMNEQKSVSSYYIDKQKQSFKHTNIDKLKSLLFTGVLKILLSISCMVSRWCHAQFISVKIP